MLKEFAIRNYKSFKNEVVFTMEPDTFGVSEFKHHISPKTGLLKVASIYGPNAGGKTNLLSALVVLKRIITEYYNIPLLLEINKEIRDVESFKFSDDDDKVVTFKVFFIDDKYEIGYHIDFEKIRNNDSDTIFFHYENVSYRPLKETEFKNLFVRDNVSVQAKELAEEMGVSSLRVADTSSFISSLSPYINTTRDNPPYLDIIFRLMKEIKSIKVLQNLKRTNTINMRALAKQYEDPDIKQKVIQILNELDINISDILIDQTNKNDPLIYCEHFAGSKKFTLKYDEESKGTHILIHNLPLLITAIKDGNIVAVDEMDAHLHPKLTQKIIELFTSEKNEKSQLIFNSHDIWNMNNENFRRDEIWFVIRNEKLESELICLSDFEDYKGDKVRKDAKYSKQYMEGKYGTDPFIKKGVVGSE